MQLASILVITSFGEGLQLEFIICFPELLAAIVHHLYQKLTTRPSGVK